METLKTDANSAKMLSASTWKPTLAADLLPSAESAIDDIAASLKGMTPERQSASALCEQALLFAYMALAMRSDDWRQCAIERLELAIEKVSRVPPAQQWFGLYGGLAEIGWIVEHVSDLIHELDGTSPSDANHEGDEDPIAEIDSVILTLLASRPWLQSYDLIGGLVGFGVYFLERLPRSSAAEGIRAVLSQLENTAEQTSPGRITWFTPPQLLPAQQLEIYPAGYYNLGVAHGVPGVVRLLGEFVRSGVEADRALALLSGAVAWLLAQQGPDENAYCFEIATAQGVGKRGSRLGWCYGDLGIAAILHDTGPIANRPEWQRLATTLIDHCLLVSRTADHVLDAPLCHGAIGVGHILNRICQASASDRYRSAANLWFDRGIGMRREHGGIAGFFAYCPERTPAWVSDPSFLSGAIGVALALLSAATNVEPQWDRLMLLSGRKEFS
jgi:hypothetical protein